MLFESVIASRIGWYIKLYWRTVFEVSVSVIKRKCSITDLINRIKNQKKKKAFLYFFFLLLLKSTIGYICAYLYVCRLFLFSYYLLNACAMSNQQL